MHPLRRGGKVYVISRAKRPSCSPCSGQDPCARRLAGELISPLRPSPSNSNGRSQRSQLALADQGKGKSRQGLVILKDLRLSTEQRLPP